MSILKIRTAGCFIEYNNKFVILHRRPDVRDANTWGLPAGIVENNESDEQAILREVEEEVGYKAKADELEFLTDLHYNFSDLYLEFPTFRIKLKKAIKVKYYPKEHDGYKWVTAKECHARKDLIRGFHELLEKIGYINNF